MFRIIDWIERLCDRIYYGPVEDGDPQMMQALDRVFATEPDDFADSWLQDINTKDRLNQELVNAEWILNYEKRLTKLQKKTAAHRSRAEQVGANTRREVLELINIEVKISPLFFPGVCSLHGGLLELRDEERAQQSAVLFPNFPLREISNEDAPLIHGFAKADRARGLAQDVAHQWRGRKLPHFILYWRDPKSLLFFVKRRELSGPECFHDRIFHLPQNLLAELRIGEEAVHAEKGGMVVEEKRREGVVHDVLHPAGAPYIAPDAFQRCDDAVDHEMMHVAVSLLERIQSHWILKIRGVEVGDMIRSMRRDAVEELFRHVPMWIDKAHSPSLVDILEDEIPKQRTFPRAGLADHVHMPPSLGSWDFDGLILAPVYGRANNAHTTPYPLAASCLCLNKPRE